MTLPRLYNQDLDEGCYRIRLTASVCGVVLEIRHLDTFPGKDHLSPAYLATNPLARLPALEHHGLVLRQGAAIQGYLASLPGARPLVPEDAGARAQMFDWMVFADRDLACASQARAVALLDAPGDGPALTAQTRAMLRIMEDHMTRQTLLGQRHFVGDTLTLADLALFPAFALSRDFNVDHDDYPSLRLWARRVRRTEGFVTMPGIPDYH